MILTLCSSRLVKNSLVELEDELALRASLFLIQKEADLVAFTVIMQLVGQEHVL